MDDWIGDYRFIRCDAGGSVTPYLFQVMERIHGHIGILALAVLLHPVLTLPRRSKISRGMRWTLWLAVLLLGLTYALGWWIYPDYRLLEKPDLIRQHIVLAKLFESKEHLAFFSLVCGFSGAAIALKQKNKDDWRVAWLLLLLGWILGVVVAGLGIAVAAA